MPSSGEIGQTSVSENQRNGISEGQGPLDDQMDQNSPGPEINPELTKWQSLLTAQELEKQIYDTRDQALTLQRENELRKGEPADKDLKWVILHSLKKYKEVEFWLSVDGKSLILSLVAAAATLLAAFINLIPGWSQYPAYALILIMNQLGSNLSASLGKYYNGPTSSNYVNEPENEETIDNKNGGC